MMSARDAALRSMVSMACVARVSVNCFEASIRAPSTALSGVRSSCDTMAMNSSLR
jgi:hypothetical protein